MTTVYSLPDLPFPLQACEPWLSAETLELHHGKHHAAYVAGANKALEQLRNADPTDATTLAGIQEALTFNVSGHVLHSLFWESFRPESSAPGGDLAAAIEDSFGTVDRCRSVFATTATGIHGAGWAGLAWDPDGERLHVVGIQDHHQGQLARATLLAVVDVWEHAYYLQYRNERARWVKAVIEHLAWDRIAHRLASARDAVRA